MTPRFHSQKTSQKSIRASLLALLAASSLSLSLSIVAVDDALPFTDKETTKLEYTVSEGTWMSLDLMPDGNTIVFELLGDLYTLPIAGGKATRILDGMGYASQPRVSPDGQWVAFISDRDGSDNLWVAPFEDSALGKPRKLSSEVYNRLRSPEWMPDSQYVLMSNFGKDTEIKMHNVNGGNGLKLSTGESGVDGMGVSVTAAGKHLYYSARTGGFGSFPLAQVYRFDITSGEVVQVTQGEGGGLRPQVSPDGSKLVYATRREAKTGLRIRDLNTGADTPLIWPIQKDSQENFARDTDLLPGYAFTPDGSALIFHDAGKINRIDIATGTKTDIPFTADISLDIGPDLTSSYRVDDDDMVKAQLIQDPSLSPDGARVAASILTKIYTVDSTDGSDPKRLTRSDAWEFEPIWSPDGRWIAYVTWSMNDGGHIWKMRSNGRGSPKRLTVDPAFYTDLAWSKDGERIVAMRGNEWQRHQTFSEFGGLDIRLDMVWLDADDGGDTNLIGAANDARNLHFGPESDRVYAYDGKSLFSVRYDGSDRKSHLSVDSFRGNRAFGPQPKAEDVRIAPDGKHALAFVAKQLYVMPVVQIGGDIPNVNPRGGAVPVQKITDVGADYYGWSSDGATVNWAIGSTFYSRPFDSIDFTPKEDKKAEAKNENESSEESNDSESFTDHHHDRAFSGFTGGPQQADAEPQTGDDEAEEIKAPEPAKDEDENVTALKITLNVPRAKPEGSILLSGANVIAMQDGTTASMENVLENQDILITDNRITAMGASGSLDIPNGTETIDVSGKYIVPGFIDTHAHWEFRTQDVLEPQNWTLATNLAYGVTAGLDVQTSHKDYFAYRDFVDAGLSVGQRAFMTGPGIFGNNDFKSYDEVYHYLRRYAEHYGTKNIKSYLVGNRKQRQWVVRASKELGIMPTTEGAGDMRLDITHAIDGMHGNEHTLTIAPMYDDVLKLYAETKTAYTPTLVVQYNGISGVNYFFTRTEVRDDPKLQRFYPRNRLNELTRRRGSWARDDEFSIDQIASAAADLQRAGGLVGIGGHGELQGLGYHWEMWLMAMGKMTNVEVLRAATIDGAKIIGIQEDLGSIEVGKMADLVVLNSNPLDNIRNTTDIGYVMKNGEFYEGDTLNQVWPVKKELTPFWWWDGDPRAKNSLQ